MRNSIRKPVSKFRGAKKFRKDVSKTHRKNVVRGMGVARGGIRL